MNESFSFLSNLPLVSNSRQVDAVRFDLITSAFFQKLMLFKNICFYYLIFLLCAFNIHFRYLLYFLDFTNGQVSNNLNVLEVFFYVNLLTYLKYTGSFLQVRYVIMRQSYMNG